MKRLILICLLVCGCNEADIKKANMENSTSTMSAELHYYKDSNTNLCFAGMYVGYNAGTLTNVPCTPEVEKVAHSFVSEK